MGLGGIRSISLNCLSRNDPVTAIGMEVCVCVCGGGGVCEFGHTIKACQVESSYVYRGGSLGVGTIKLNSLPRSNGHGRGRVSWSFIIKNTATDRQTDRQTHRNINK